MTLGFQQREAITRRCHTTDSSSVVVSKRLSVKRDQRLAFWGMESCSELPEAYALRYKIQEECEDVYVRPTLRKSRAYLILSSDARGCLLPMRCLGFMGGYLYSLQTLRALRRRRDFHKQHCHSFVVLTVKLWV